MASKRRRRFERQARRQGRIRYAPEESALGLLEQDARRDFRDTRAGARSAADAIVTSAQQGAADIADIYENAGLTDLVRGSLESNPAARRLAEEMAGAEVEMRHREVDAREGAAFAVREARKNRDRTLTDINRRRTALANERGLFVNDLLSQLIGEDNAARAAAADKAADRANSRGNALIGAGIDPSTGMAIPGGRLDPDADGRPGDKAKAKAKNWLPPDSMRSQHALIQKAVAQAKRLKRAGRNVTEAGQLLTEGRDPITIYVDSKGKKVPKKIQDGRGRWVENPDAVKQTIPEVPVFDELAARIALEVVFGRGITPGTRKRANQSGIRLQPLGYPFTPPSRPHPGVVVAPGVGGRQQRPG